MKESAGRAGRGGGRHGIIPAKRPAVLGLPAQDLDHFIERIPVIMMIWPDPPAVAVLSAPIRERTEAVLVVLIDAVEGQPHRPAGLVHGVCHGIGAPLPHRRRAHYIFLLRGCALDAPVQLHVTARGYADLRSVSGSEQLSAGGGGGLAAHSTPQEAKVAASWSNSQSASVAFGSMDWHEPGT